MLGVSVKELDAQKLSEMSMIDIAYELLKEGKEPRDYQTLFDEIANLKNMSDEERQRLVSQLYTDINVDGRFKTVGDGVWGLRSWYPYEQVEEPIMSEPKKKKKKKAAKEDILDDELDEDLDDVDNFDDIDDIDDDIDDIDDIEDIDEEIEDIDEDLDDDIDDIDEDLDETDNDDLDEDLDEEER